MIRKKSTEKIIIPLIGLISGILLFLGVFSLSAEATVFNYDYHRDSLKELGISGLIIDKAYESIEAYGYRELLGSLIEERVTEDMIFVNIKSLVGGLLKYIKGVTDMLPYIYFNQTNEFSDSANSVSQNERYTGYDIQLTPEEIAASPILSLSKIDKVNLRLLVMFYDEQRVDDLLKTASLIQYLTRNLLITIIILLSIITIIIIHRKTTIFLSWFKFTAFFYSLLCIAAICSVTKFRNYSHYILSNITSSTNADFIGFAKRYLTIVSGSIIRHLFLSVILILLLLFIILYRFGSFSDHFPSLPHQKSKSVLWMAVLVLTALCAALYFQINNAAAEYKQRNMNQAVLFLQGNKTFNQATDVKGNDVCFLRVSVFDGLTGEPMDTAAINICKTDISAASIIKAVTDDNGSAALLLEKGSYRLISAPPEVYHDLAFYDPSEAHPDLAYHAPAVYDFKLTRPGRTELKIVLDKHSGTAMHIKSADLQYIP